MLTTPSKSRVRNCQPDLLITGGAGDASGPNVCIPAMSEEKKKCPKSLKAWDQVAHLWASDGHPFTSRASALEELLTPSLDSLLSPGLSCNTTRDISRPRATTARTTEKSWGWEWPVPAQPRRRGLQVRNRQRCCHVVPPAPGRQQKDTERGRADTKGEF